MDRSDHYCVIGAGPAGLIAARALKNAGIPYEQLERNDDVGGIWEIKNDWSPMYETAHFISSKTVSHIPGAPMPDDYPDYPNHRQILAYLKRFAQANDLYPNITFSRSVARIERDKDQWRVTTDGATRSYRGLFICSGNTWDPNLPKYPGAFEGESLHSVRYKTPQLFEGKRVLIVGAGNSGCDIACDAARSADRALISMRRGYHFIPKYIFGAPADVFASKVALPGLIERKVNAALLRMLVGDLTRYGLPKPDHDVLESHPIMNTELLHHIGHGDLAYRPDIERFEGRRVIFKDGRADEIDLIVYATGYNVTYPFMDRSHFQWISKYPDLYLSGLHREYDNLCCLGLHQTDGGAYDLFNLQADMMCNFILDQQRNPARARAFAELKKQDRPNLSGGLRYVDSPRHATYVKKTAFKRYCDRIMKRFHWSRFVEAPARSGRLTLRPT